MEQRDYLKKLIDSLGHASGKVLASVFGLKSEGKPWQVTQLSWQALKKEADLDMETMLQLPEEAFLERLKNFEKLKLPQLNVVSKLLFESVEGMDSGPGKEGLIKRLIFLLEYLDKEDSTFFYERHYEIEQLKAMIKDC